VGLITAQMVAVVGEYYVVGKPPLAPDKYVF